MANWVIRCSERYLSLVYDRLRQQLCAHDVLQADETRCQVIKDGRIPIDNSATERAIRSFTIGRANRHVIDTIHGVQASAVVYSLVETAKANHLRIYEYLKYLLTEIPKHMEDTSLAFLDDLLPWSEKLPDVCKRQK